MALAGVIGRYEDELICDLAEVYQIYDYKGVPGRLLGTLVSGLGVNSRVYQKIAGQKVPTDILFEAFIIDELRRITYLLDGNKNKKQPEPMSETLFDRDEPENDVMVFDSPEAFEQARAALLGEINGKPGSR